MNWNIPKGWEAVGFLGQFIFMSRFVVQWLASERKGQSVVPLSFWLLSLGGSLTVLAYAIAIQNRVFIVAQSFGFIVYIRNLMLLNRKKQAGDGAG